MYCQKCRSPLKLDSSLLELNPAAYDLLVAASSQPHAKQPVSAPARPSQPQDGERRGLYGKITKNAAAAMFRKQGNAHRADGSFILLTESQLAPPRLTGPQDGPSASSPASSRRRRGSSFSAGSGLAGNSGKASQPHEAERMDKLFEILSARSDIDHPICVECTDFLVDGLQKRLENSVRERSLYADYLKQMQADTPTDEDIAAAEKVLKQANKDQSEAMKTLIELEKEKAALDDQLASLEENARTMDTDEKHFWSERNSFATRLSDFQNERDSINSRFDHDSQQLTKLQRANVYNDTFSIHHDGVFATINGLRLGRMSTKPVDWPEINAALGQALLLLATVSDKLGYKFDSYEPLPMGSTSKIIRYDHPSPSSSRSGAHRGGPPQAPKKHVLELYSSGDLPLNLLWHRKFDTAMVAFLELVKQLGAHVKAQTAHLASGVGREGPGTPDDKHLKLPYEIEGDKIGTESTGHYSIKLGIANDESWTKACKFALTCCKFLIAHASNIGYGAPPNGRS